MAPAASRLRPPSPSPSPSPGVPRHVGPAFHGGPASLVSPLNDLTATATITVTVTATAVTITVTTTTTTTNTIHHHHYHLTSLSEKSMPNISFWSSSAEFSMSANELNGRFHSW